MKRIVLVARQEAIRLGKEERGVAFVLTLGVFMLMFMLCCGVYAVGDTVRQKIELQNAADAAAYSAAVVQADTLSRIATINRAMAWTYVQMTRRQLDFITYQWLARTVKVFNEDLKAVKDWNRFSICIPCDKEHYAGKVRADTCWCGIDSSNIGKVRINGLSSIFDQYLPGINTIRSIPFAESSGFGQDVAISQIKDAFDRWNGELFKAASMSSMNRANVLSGFDVGNQILMDKLNIYAMNIAEMDLVLKMPDRIKSAANDILKANLPADLVDRGDVQFYLYQNEYPLTYFRTLNNTRDDERIFLSFADYYDKQNKVFRGDPSVLSTAAAFQSQAELWLMDKLGLNISGGVDRWFVRGDGSRRAKDSDIGIQRSYKMWPEDILKSLHPSKHLPILPPTCLNFNGDDNSPSKLTGYRWRSGQPYPSIGLYSEWQWYSMLWFCYLEPVPIPHVIHQTVVSKFWCKHCSFDIKIKKNKNCLIWPGEAERFRYHVWRRGRFGIPRRRSVTTGGIGTTDFGIPVMRGYTRVYGDDKKILESYKEQYIGAKCLPMLLSPSFFGKPGSLVVGVSRKNRNPWSLILNKCDGIFGAFEPGVSHMWAVSAARAGYRKVDGGVGEYHLDWTDPADNRARWNLKQPDWDAVFLPVRDAWKLCAWDMFVPGLNLFGGKDNILEDLINSEWGKDQDWTELKPPPGMRGADSDSKLDWGALSKKLLH